MTESKLPEWAIKIEDYLGHATTSYRSLLKNDPPDGTPKSHIQKLLKALEVAVQALKKVTSDDFDGDDRAAPVICVCADAVEKIESGEFGDE